ncbi:MAG TPA: glycoside hydrolase family 95 protein [Nonomuraea sp.]|nr:glycoside hydrolase family 95 protein [Nonomuraea sp.]
MTSAPDDLTLWYEEPAADWETQALPIGNGPLGAMVFGGVRSERIQFNEKTLWTGGPGHDGYDFGNWAAPRPGAVEEVRRRIDREGRVPAEEVAAALGQPKTGFGAYQTFGDLHLDFGEHGEPEGYRRELRLAEAVARVRYTAGDVAYTREYFAANPGNVIAARLTAGRGGAVSFTLRHTSPRDDKTVTAEGGRLTIRGRLADNGLVFEAQVQVLAEGGTRTDEGETVTVTGADSAVLILSAGTDYADTYPHYRGEDPHARVTAAVDAAAALGYDALRAAHVADYRELFGRVRLDLGQSAPEIPTDRLLRRYTGGGGPEDRAVEALLFQYGRYLLIACSRENDLLPANLQGVWNDSTSPPWSGDYHLNINLQMNYWPAGPANLHETTRPYDRYIASLTAPGSRTAREMFGARGWVVGNETNPFGFTGVHDWPTAFWFPEAAAWASRHLYDSYRFTGDLDYLRETAYPVIKGAAEFWLDFLHTDPTDGRLVVSPSYSPEHGGFSAGASMSQQIVREVLAAALAAATTLGVDEEFRAAAGEALARLDPGIRVGSWGQLQEWKRDWDSRTDTHRHVSHLYALHPGDLIAAGSPEAEAAAVSLAARGDGGTGWSKAWKISFWARLLDGDRAHRMLGELLRHSTLDNLWDSHPPFQIDGNFGATAGIAEMLLQSHRGVVHVLPSLPAAWKDGAVTGLRARGDVTVDVTWRDGLAETITVRPGRTGPITVRTPAGRYRVHDLDQETETGTLTWHAEAGRGYLITRS